MKFEIGKFYKHTNGHCLAILCEADTTMYGNSLIAEQTGSSETLIAVGMDEDNASNYHEITKEEWMSNFVSVEVNSHESV